MRVTQTSPSRSHLSDRSPCEDAFRPNRIIPLETTHDNKMTGRVSSIRFPGIASNSPAFKGAYKSFLSGIQGTQANKKSAVAQLTKEDVDEAFEKRLREHAHLNESAISRIMTQEVCVVDALPVRWRAMHANMQWQTKSVPADKSFASFQQWASKISHHSQHRHSGLQVHAPTSNLPALDLPAVAESPKDEKYEFCERQKYADFATRAIKRNPKFTFTKETMDQAFELMANKKLGKINSKESRFVESLNKMMLPVSLGCHPHRPVPRSTDFHSQCLGKESDVYWRKR